MDKNKKILKKTILGIILLGIIVILGFVAYDKITINNQYYIGEKNIRIPIFVYHNIVKEESQIEYDYMQTPKNTFEKQIKGLKDRGYHFINYDELVNYKEGKQKLYKKSCILTFDDGYDGVYENAYPIAQKYNIPFTMFIINENMDTPGVITWKQAEEMKNSGIVTIASHSIEHPEFTSLSVEEAVKDVNESYKEINEKLGNTNLKIFTYPYGLYKKEQLQAIGKEGYIQNLTDNKINKSEKLDLYGLHRCYPLNDSIYKILLKIEYRSIRYN